MTDCAPINDATVQAYRDAARSIWQRDGEIEIDDDAEISHGSEYGAYVHAWVWVPDGQLDPGPGPSYDVWITELDDGEERYVPWRFDSRFTCDDDPDGKGARGHAHGYARHLRQTYPCAFVAVRQGCKGSPRPIHLSP
jgi:hypothetical protein